MGKFVGLCANRGVAIVREQDELLKSGGERVALCRCGLHVFMQRRSVLMRKGA